MACLVLNQKPFRLTNTTNYTPYANNTPQLATANHQMLGYAHIQPEWWNETTPVVTT